MRRVILSLGVVALVVVAIVLLRAVRFPSRQIRAEPVTGIEVDEAGIAERLAAAVRYETVSHQDEEAIDGTEFAALHRYLEQSFPRAHQRLRREVVGRNSLLYTWPGREDGPPVLLMGHMDVVPVEREALAVWTHPPFAGVIADGYVWGRGTMDDKASVLGVLEAVESLLENDFEPSRTILLAFGDDEEVGGARGARVIATRLGERGVTPALVLDEGGSLVTGFLPGLDSPVATIGITEKGYLSVELSVRVDGGHSSVPPPQTAVGIVSAAVQRLEANPVSADLDSVVGQTLEYVGPELSLLPRLVVANTWLFGPALEAVLSRSPPTNATIRTTTAATIFEAGVKDNILPSTARAVVNFRILPGDTVGSVLDHVRRVVDDPRVEVNPLSSATEPSPVSPVDGEAFRTLQRTVREIFPTAVVAPSLVLGATDARHYTQLTTNVYRFLPIRLEPDDVRRFHGIDERLGIADYANVVRFYIQLLRNLSI